MKRPDISKIILLLGIIIAFTTLPLRAEADMTQKIDSDFRQKTAVLSDPAPADFIAATPGLTPREQEAMKFLYAYMMLADWGGYSPDFYLENVRASFRAVDEMPWGKTVPKREFMHFVLPVRVNNEDLDMSRPIFFEELKERVKNLTMEEAILEVNHWCHEKATYQPSDGRTSSPLSTVSQAIGRCGEESTFTVAALRSVGIPARQVYTPRWAHTDDNHAWVEAWANGKWYFLGACEPEPILNFAWFNSPASRGMLMNTKVFGNYDGPEEVLERTPTNTIINVTANYAPVHDVKVRICDTDHKPVENATVNFSLYNYAEFYPVAKKYSDRDGLAALTCGLGDMVVWATDGKNFGVTKVSPTDNGVTDIVLDKTPEWTGIMEFDIIPPAPSATLPTPTSEQRRLNNTRTAYEDSLRMAYVATFATDDDAAALARQLSIDEDKTAKILTESRGNHRMIKDFLSSTPAPLRSKALDLLLAVSEKDRRDISPAVLHDHLSTPEADSKLYNDYLLNPRIENEGLTPYKSFFHKNISDVDAEKYRNNPLEWVNFCRQNVTIDTLWNQLNIRMSPEAVWKLRRADKRSRDIFFVAGARSMGIPSRIDPVTGKTQYADNSGNWIDVKFENADPAPSGPKGKLTLPFEPVGRIVDPKYYSQFSISKIENGLPHLLEFGEGDTASDINKQAMDFDEGRYMLVTGQRLANGGVLARAELFDIKADENTVHPLTIRQDKREIQVIGSLNSEGIYHDLAESKDKSLLSTTGRGYYILGLIQPNHEPTVHTLNDISALAGEFEKWGKKIVLLFADRNEAQRFDASRFPKLPSNVVFGTDIDGKIIRELTESLNLPTDERPIFVVADTFNRVVFVSQGYTIGLGETLTDIIHRIKD